MDKEDTSTREKGYILDKGYNDYCAMADFIWGTDAKMYVVSNGVKIVKPKLSNTESARLAILKMCPDFTEIKGIGYSTSIVYGVIRDE